jgi:membrane-associated phospholipid phosphatase
MHPEKSNFLSRLTEKDSHLSKRWSIAQKPGLQRTLAILITYSGDGLPLLMLADVLIGIGPSSLRARAALLLIADGVASLVTQVIKFTVRRPRPGGVWGGFYRTTDPRSFPSAHATRGGAMTGMGMGLGLAVGPAWLGIVAVAWGVLVSYSRVAMGVHYLSDVTAGFLIGLTVSAFTAVMLF